MTVATTTEQFMPVKEAYELVARILLKNEMSDVEDIVDDIFEAAGIRPFSTVIN